MAGNKEGGLAAADSNKRRYGKDYYRRIGRKGGKASNNGGFAAGAEGRARASFYGAIGGSISRRVAK